MKQDESKRCKHGEPVKWNQWNKVVQCHKCGEIFISITECKKLK